MGGGGGGYLDRIWLIAKVLLTKLNGPDNPDLLKQTSILDLVTNFPLLQRWGDS